MAAINQRYKSSLPLTAATSLAIALAATIPAYAEGISSQYQGRWSQAVLKKGATSPQLSPCIATKIGSMHSAIEVSAKSGLYTATNVLGSADCKGPNTIKARYSYDFKPLSQKGKDQVLQVYRERHEVTIAGAETVKQLNAKKVCGFAGWEAKTYVSGKSPLNGCTFKNMALSIPPHISATDIKNWRTKLSLVGSGLAVASAMSPKGQFVHATYYVKK